MKTLKAIALASVAAMALTPTVSSAQVVNDIENLIQNINAGVANKFNSAALNFSAVDGSVNIAVGGANGGTTAGTDNTVTITAAATDNSISGAVTDASGAGSTALGGTSDIDALPIGFSAGGTDGGAYEFAFGASLDVTDTVGELSESVDTSSDTMTEATTATVGDISATALGAVLSGDIDIDETAGAISATSGSTAGSTSADAAFGSDIGSGVGVISVAANLALIDGSVTASVTNGNTNFGSISTTAAGAINSSGITAAIVGVNNGAVPTP